eukprot:g17165.t1
MDADGGDHSMMPSEEIEALAPCVVVESNDAKKQRGKGEGFEAAKGGKGKQSWSVGGGSQPTGFHDMHNTPLTNVCVIIFQGEHSTADVNYAAPRPCEKLLLSASGGKFPKPKQLMGPGFAPDTASLYDYAKKQTIRCTLNMGAAWTYATGCVDMCEGKPDDFVYGFAFCYIYECDEFKKGVAKYCQAMIACGDTGKQMLLQQVTGVGINNQTAAKLQQGHAATQHANTQGLFGGSGSGFQMLQDGSVGASSPSASHSSPGLQGPAPPPPNLISSVINGDLRKAIQNAKHWRGDRLECLEKQTKIAAAEIDKQKTSAAYAARFQMKAPNKPEAGKPTSAKEEKRMREKQQQEEAAKKKADEKKNSNTTEKSGNKKPDDQKPAGRQGRKQNKDDPKDDKKKRDDKKKPEGNKVNIDPAAGNGKPPEKSPTTTTGDKPPGDNPLTPGTIMKQGLAMMEEGKKLMEKKKLEEKDAAEKQLEEEFEAKQKAELKREAQRKKKEELEKMKEDLLKKELEKKEKEKPKTPTRRNRNNSKNDSDESGSPDRNARTRAERRQGRRDPRDGAKEETAEKTEEGAKGENEGAAADEGKSKKKSIAEIIAERAKERDRLRAARGGDAGKSDEKADEKQDGKKPEEKEASKTSENTGGQAGSAPKPKAGVRRGRKDDTDSEAEGKPKKKFQRTEDGEKVEDLGSESGSGGWGERREAAEDRDESYDPGESDKSVDSSADAVNLSRLGEDDGEDGEDEEEDDDDLDDDDLEEEDEDEELSDVLDED